MPSIQFWRSLSTCRPCAPARRSTFSCLATKLIVCWLGVNERAEVTRPNGLMPGHVERRQICRAEAFEQQQPAVLGRDPSRAEHDVGARLAVDVRDVVLVAQDLQTRPPRLLSPDDRPCDAELLRQVVAAQVRGRDVALERRELVVELPLIGGVLVGGQAAELAGRKDVERRSREVDLAPQRTQPSPEPRRASRQLRQRTSSPRGSSLSPSSGRSPRDERQPNIAAAAHAVVVIA